MSLSLVGRAKGNDWKGSLLKIGKGNSRAVTSCLFSLLLLLLPSG